MFDQAGDSSETGIGPDTPQGGKEDEPLDGLGGEGRAKEQATPPIASDAEPGETQHEAPSDDVGGQRGGEDRPGAWLLAVKTRPLQAAGCERRARARSAAVRI